MPVNTLAAPAATTHKKMPMIRKFIFLSLGLVALSVFSAAAAEPLTAEKVAKAFGFTEDQKKQLYAGEIVSASLPEVSDQMLATVTVILFPVEPRVVTDAIMAGRIFAVTREVDASGEIDPKEPERGLAAAVLTEGDISEVKKILNPSPGSELNLSTAEIAFLKKARDEGGITSENASKAYQQVLAGRVRDYAEGGIKNIAPYDRGDGEKACACDDIRIMDGAMEVLAKYYPNLHKAYLNYPHTPFSDEPAERFMWERYTILGRPVFSLSHSMLHERPGVLIWTMREYFAGHEYNASSVASGAFGVHEGTIFFVSVRTTSDQVSGFGGMVKRPIGRTAMLGIVAEFLQDLRIALEKDNKK